MQYDDESVLLSKVTEWLAPQRRDGIRVLRVSDAYARGYADLFICARGWFVVAELKAANGTASYHQDVFLEDMRAAGAVSGICRSVRDVADLVEEAKRRSRAGREFDV
jgi:hypothetical protein